VSVQLSIWMHVRREKHSVPGDNQIYMCVCVCVREREMFRLKGDVICICDIKFS